MLRIINVLLFMSAAALADGVVSPEIRISSESLGYDLQYRVYTPASINTATDLSVLYVTDGPGYISQGKMPNVLDKMIEAGEIDPIIVVFVDPRDPDNLRKNRRNSQFLCNANYLEFYENELVSEIEASYPVGTAREYRGILGLSFGGTNAACFGLLGHETFFNIGMQSPANHPVDNLLPAYTESPRLPLKMFLSTGKPNDNTQANRSFHTVLKDKGYSMQYLEVREGHNWDNWRPLLDDVLRYFYGSDDAEPASEQP